MPGARQSKNSDSLRRERDHKVEREREKAEERERSFGDGKRANELGYAEEEERQAFARVDCQKQWRTGREGLGRETRGGKDSPFFLL